MYKTIRHGENSLQYTILPQHENGIDGKQLITRRRRKRDLITYIIVFFITLIIGGALTISLRLLFHNPRWLENGNRMTMHMKERLYEAFYGKNYAEVQQQQNRTLNDIKIASLNAQTSIDKNWSNDEISTGSETKKSQFSTETFPTQSTPLILLTSSTPITITTTTAAITSTSATNLKPEATDLASAWKSVIKTEKYAYDRQNENKMLHYTSNPIPSKFDDLYKIRRNYNDAQVSDVQRDDSHNSQIVRPMKMEEPYSSSSTSWSSSLSVITTTSTITPSPTLRDSLTSTTGKTKIAYVNRTKQNFYAQNGSNKKPWIKSYWPFVDSSTYFQWTVSDPYLI